MANVVFCNNSNLCKNNYYYALATEFVTNPSRTLSAHHTGIANSGSNGHYFAPDAPVANYNPVGVRVANGYLKCSVASATFASATLLPLVASSGHVMPNFPHTLIGLRPFANQECTILFTQTSVIVYHPDGHPILLGWQDETGPHLWHFPLTTKASNPQDATVATAPQPPIPAPTPLPAPPPSVTQLPQLAPLVVLPAVSAANHPHPSQGILVTSTSGVACLSMTYSVQPQQPMPQVPHLTHAALIFPALVSWLDSIMPTWALRSSRLGSMPSKPATATPRMASPTPMQPGIVQMLTRQSWAILPSNTKMSGQQNPSRHCRHC
jgi:hypothetical protein